MPCLVDTCTEYGPQRKLSASKRILVETCIWVHIPSIRIELGFTWLLSDKVVHK